MTTVQAANPAGSPAGTTQPQGAMSLADRTLGAANHPGRAASPPVLLGSCSSTTSWRSPPGCVPASPSRCSARPAIR